jgi:hypothetical protein
MMILTTKVLKIQRDAKSDVRKPNFNSVLNYVLPVRPIQSKSSPPDLSGPFTGFQRRFLNMSDLGQDMSGEQYDVEI